jgi:hypothetical protein
MKLWKAMVLSLLVVGACDDDDSTEPPDTMTVTLETVLGNVTGSALITDIDGPTSTVQVTLQGLTVGETYVGHIHDGSCTDPGEILVTLQSITAATTTASVTTNNVPDSMIGEDHIIQYHLQMAASTPAVACGEITE